MWRGAIACVLMSSLYAFAQPAGRTEVVELLGMPGALVRRIEGQTSDLELTLRSRPGAQVPERSLDALRGEGIRARAWVRSAGEGVALHLLDLQDRRAFVRVVDGALTRSATLEAVAVALRSALRALSRGGQIGVLLPPPSPAASDSAPPEPAPPAWVMQPHVGVALRLVIRSDREEPLTP